LPDIPTDGVGEDLLDSVVLTGLRPGEQRILTPAEIYLRLAEAGINAAAHRWSWPSSVIITRLSQAVSSEALLAAGERAIRRQLNLSLGDQATVTPLLKPRPILAPVGQLTLDAVARPPRLAGGLWIADITGIQDGKSVLDSTIRYRVRVTGDILVVSRSVRRGVALSGADVVRQTREISGLRGDPLRTIEQLIGRRAARAASPGTILTTDWIEPIPAVRRGEFITAVARIRAVRATATVLALADGAVGDIIRVRTDRERKEFLVRVSGPGCAEVILSQ